MKNYCLLLVCLFVFSSGYSQKHTISGYIEDAASSERLAGASIFNSDKQQLGTATNTYGFYSLTLPAGKCRLSSTYIGYTPIHKEIILSADTVINFRLVPSLELEEVSISSKRNHVKTIRQD